MGFQRGGGFRGRGDRGGGFRGGRGGGGGRNFDAGPPDSVIGKLFQGSGVNFVELSLLMSITS